MVVRAIEYVWFKPLTTSGFVGSQKAERDTKIRTNFHSKKISPRLGFWKVRWTEKTCAASKQTSACRQLWKFRSTTSSTNKQSKFQISNYKVLMHYLLSTYPLRLSASKGSTPYWTLFLFWEWTCKYLVTIRTVGIIK